jgi:hypothetical protein
LAFVAGAGAAVAGWLRGGKDWAAAGKETIDTCDCIPGKGVWGDDYGCLKLWRVCAVDG